MPNRNDERKPSASIPPPPPPAPAPPPPAEDVYSGNNFDEWINFAK